MYQSHYIKNEKMDSFISTSTLRDSIDTPSFTSIDMAVSPPLSPPHASPFYFSCRTLPHVPRNIYLVLRTISHRITLLNLAVASATWTSKDIFFSAPSPTDFIDTSSSEILLRVYASGTQTGYVDFVSVVAGGDVVLTPAPTPTPTPGGGSGSPGVAVYVEKVLGEDILTSQSNGAALAVSQVFFYME